MGLCRLEEAKRAAADAREKLERQNQQLSDLEAELGLLRRRVEQLETDRDKDKKLIAQLQESLNRARAVRSLRQSLHQGRNHWGVRTPQKNLDGPPQLFYEECDYRYVTACSARNWVYHPHFVLYNNLHQGIGPPTLKTWLRPCSPQAIRAPDGHFLSHVTV